MLALAAVVVALVLVVIVAGWALSLILSAAITGLIVGALARLAIPGRQNIGLIMTILVGWIGSLLGSMLGSRVFHFGWVLTGLTEVAVAAVLVVILSASASGSTAGSRQS